VSRVKRGAGYEVSYLRASPRKREDKYRCCKEGSNRTCVVGDMNGGEAEETAAAVSSKGTNRERQVGGVEGGPKVKGPGWRNDVRPWRQGGSWTEEKAGKSKRERWRGEVCTIPIMSSKSLPDAWSGKRDRDCSTGRGKSNIKKKKKLTHRGCWVERVSLEQKGFGRGKKRRNHPQFSFFGGGEPVRILPRVDGSKGYQFRRMATCRKSERNRKRRRTRHPGTRSQGTGKGKAGRGGVRESAKGFCHRLSTPNKTHPFPSAKGQAGRLGTGEWGKERTLWGTNGKALQKRSKNLQNWIPTLKAFSRKSGCQMPVGKKTMKSKGGAVKGKHHTMRKREIGKTEVIIVRTKQD